MRRFHGILAILLVAALSACGDSPESVSNDMIDSMDELTAVLAEIKTKDDVEAKTTEIEGILQDFKDLKARADELEKSMSDEDKAAIEKEFEPRFKTSSQAFGKEMTRIMTNPELAPAFQKLSAKFEALGN